MSTRLDTTHFVGMDFDNPNLGVQGIAAGFGARVEKIDTLAAVGEALGSELYCRAALKGSSSICVHPWVWHSDETTPLIGHGKNDAWTPGPGIQVLEAENPNGNWVVSAVGLGSGGRCPDC